MVGISAVRFGAVALLGLVALGGVALVVAVSPWWWFLTGPLLALAATGVHDLAQRRHSVLRNYPVLGHARFLLEGIRPELQQYFVERNFDGRPYDRDVRSIVYQRAAGIEPDLAQDIALAGYEALANVADHAYQNNHGGLVDLEAALHDGRVEVVIIDHGQWRAPVAGSARVSLRGRGLMLLRASADAAEITPGADGTVVTLGWNLPVPSSH